MRFIVTHFSQFSYTGFILIRSKGIFLRYICSEKTSILINLFVAGRILIFLFPFFEVWKTSASRLSSVASTNFEKDV